MSSLRCEQLLAYCILLLLGPAQAQPPYPAGQVYGCSAGQECVPQNKCQIDVIINTDGSGRLGARAPATRLCRSQEYPYDIMICCRNAPVPSVGCSAGQECVKKNQCQNGVIITDGRGLLGSRSTICTGVHQCCNLPIVETPPLKYTAAQGCGFSNSNTDSNSVQVSFGQFPWQVLIEYGNPIKRCGASIIGDSWLLTAAHCVHGFIATNSTIRVGEWEVGSDSEPLPSIDVDLKYITIHPNFSNPSRNFQNDIAVLELSTPLDMEYHINSICLPSSGQSHWGQRCISTGWGKDVSGGSYQNILKKVDLPLVDDQKCQNLLATQDLLGPYFILDESFICAGGEANKDACEGDGGGPLACQGSDGRYVLTGITATGVDGKCGDKDVPSLYVDVANFIPWIKKITGIN